MIDDISSYIKSVVREIDSDLKFDGFVFDSTQIAEHNLDYTFRMKIGNARITRQDQAIIMDFPITVKIYKVTNIDKQDQDFEKTYCKAIDICSRAMNQYVLDQAGYIKRVNATGVNPNPVLENDTTMVFTLQLEVRTAFKYKI